jgi:hypothetical protein
MSSYCITVGRPLLADRLACVKPLSGVQYSLIFKVHVTDNKELSMNLSK